MKTGSLKRRRKSKGIRKRKQNNLFVYKDDKKKEKNEVEMDGEKEAKKVEEERNEGH